MKWNEFYQSLTHDIFLAPVYVFTGPEEEQTRKGKRWMRCEKSYFLLVWNS